jgi:hypothetical protein
VLATIQEKTLDRLISFSFFLKIFGLLDHSQAIFRQFFCWIEKKCIKKEKKVASPHRLSTWS